MPGNKFRVDTDKLEAVTTRVQNLLDSVSGNAGNVPGSKTDFGKAEVRDLTDAIKSLLNYQGGGTDPFTEGYGYEHEGMTRIYDNMITQLTNLHTACHATVEQYKKHEHASRTAVNASDGNGRIVG